MEAPFSDSDLAKGFRDAIAEDLARQRHRVDLQICGVGACFCCRQRRAQFDTDTTGDESRLWDSGSEAFGGLARWNVSAVEEPVAST